MKAKTLYLAGYIHGERIAECNSWRELISEYVALRDLDVDVINPICGHEPSTLTPDGLESSTPPHCIIHRDYRMVTSCDVMIANMDRFGQDRVPFGTICELAWAFEHHRPIIIITSERQFRKHPFCEYFASAFVDTVQDIFTQQLIEYFLYR